jgi:hypothetical protein
LRTAATRLGPGRGGIVLGDHATHDHAAEIVEQRIYRALHIAADILEIHIDALGAGCFERRTKIHTPMVNAAIKP